MKELEPHKSYIIPDDGFDIYIFALGRDWVAIKYGKNDSVATRPAYSFRDNLLKKSIKELDFSDPGFSGIGRYIIISLFEDKIGEQIDMVGK